MKKRYTYSLEALLIVFALIAPLSKVVAKAEIAEKTAPGSEVTLLESTASGLIFDLNLPSYHLEAGVSDLGSCSRVRMEGWSADGPAGYPELPGKGVMIGLPPGTVAKVTVLESGPWQVIGHFIPCPIPTPIQTMDKGEKVQDLEEQSLVDPVAYSLDSSSAQLALLGQGSQMRSQSVVQVRVQPVRYNPASQTVIAANQVRVKVDFVSLSSVETGGELDEGPFETLLQGTLLNYQEARSWRVKPVIQAPTLQSVKTSQPAFKLAVNQDGLVKMTYADLLAAGLPLSSIDPRTFHLSNHGSEIAIFIQGEADGSFDSSDHLIFYGQKTDTRYTDTNIYWLTRGGNDGLRMATVDGTPAGADIPPTFRATVHSELDKSYLSNTPSGPSGDVWYWELVIGTSTPVSKSYSVNLTNVSSAVGTARVRGLLKGFAAKPLQHTKLYINDHQFLDSSWPAKGELNFDVEIPQSYLSEGNNTIKLELPMVDGGNPILQDYLLTNWFEIEYNKTYRADGNQTYFNGDLPGNWDFDLTGLVSNDQMVFNISDPLNPVRISGLAFTPVSDGYTLSFQQTLEAKARYLAAALVDMAAPASISLAQAGDLHSPATGADYVIISHPDFLNAIQPLADFHAAEGKRVKVVNVFDIYDEFSDGVFDPGAIHDFIEYTYENWPRPAPMYILLVGDGNYDFKNFLGKNQSNFIPPFLINSDPWLGEVAADNRFVTVSGDDPLPDLAIGRLPVQTEQETNAVVSKILEYPATTSGDWAKKVLLVAGNNDSIAGDFSTLSDSLSGILESWDLGPIDKVFFPTWNPANPPNTAALRLSILDAINQGRGIIHYAGHSTTLGWYGDALHSDSSSLFNSSSITGLTNSGKLPFMVSMTCLVGNFNNPYMRVLDESLLLTPETGTIASWSPIGKGLSEGHDLLDRGLIQALYQQQVPDLGRATMQAKYYLAANSMAYQDLLDTFILLGDPALKLHTNRINVYLPMVQ